MGLATEVRNGDNQSLLVFVKVASDKHLNNAVYRSRYANIAPTGLLRFLLSSVTGWKTTTNADSRVKDWLYGVRAAQPDKETQTSLTSQPLTQAERFRIVHHMITSPREEGGAGLTPKQGEWKNVESIFPLHDRAFNKEWMRKWASSTFITAEDLDELRDRLGEKVRKYKVLLGMASD